MAAAVEANVLDHSSPRGIWSASIFGILIELQILRAVDEKYKYPIHLNLFF
jgi:hypothetical protein